MELSTEEVVKMIKAFQTSLENLRKEMTEQIEELKTHFYDDFIKPAEDNYTAWEHDTKLNDFKEKYKDLFDDELCEACKKAEGVEDLDVLAKVFDGYEESDKSIEEAQWVANVVSSLKEQLNLIKKETGAEEVTVEAEGDKVEVKADGETVAKVETVETPVENVAEVKEESEEEQLIRELEEYKNKA